MKRTALALLLLAACQPSKKEDPKPDPNAELVAAAQLMFDMSKLSKGDWARYTIREEGKGPQVVKFAAVSGDENGIWIENKVPADPAPFIVKSHYGWKGELLERWVGEPGSQKPAKIYPPEKKSDGGETPKQPEEPKVATKIEEERISVSGRTFDCTKITTTLTYSSGRTSTLTNWCSPEVPFSVLHEGKSYGGLVKRLFGKITMELANYGQDAQVELVIPGK